MEIKISKGWYVALGLLGFGALMNARRPGEMTELRDQIYRDCLAGRMPVERMKAIAAEFERARCYPQARMLYKRIALEEMTPEKKEERRQIYRKALASTNRAAVFAVAAAFEEEGSTTSAARLRRHAEKLPDPLAVQPIVTPPPDGAETPSEPPPAAETVGRPTLNGSNGVSEINVAVSSPASLPS